MPPLILPRRGLIYPGNFRAGYDPGHLASAPNKGVGGTGATSFSSVARGANAVNLLTGAKGTASSITAKMDGVIGPSSSFGSNISFPGSTTCPNIYTFAAIVRPSALAASIYGIVTTSNGTGGLSFMVNGSKIPVINLNGASSASPGAGFALTNGVPYFIAISCNLSNTSNYVFNQVQLNLNTGQLLSTTYTSSSGAIGSLTTAQAGGVFHVGDNNGFSFSGVISAAMAESTFLTLPQLRQWAADPWSFWYPQKFDLASMLGGTAAGGAINVNVTGVESDSAVGTPTVTGVANVSTITGVVSTAAAGSPTVTGFANISVNGVAATGSLGSLTETGFANVLPIGVSSTSAAGAPTVTGFANVPVTGVFATGSAGSVTVTVGGAISVNVTGVVATSAAGTPAVTGFANVATTGVQAADAVGSVAVAAQANVSVTGVEAAGSAGTLTLTGFANVLGTGVQAVGLIGDIIVSVPTGVSVTPLGVSAIGLAGIPDVGGIIPPTVGGGGIIRGDTYDKREVDRLYEELRSAHRRIKNKKAKKAVEQAIEVVESLEGKGLLSALIPTAEVEIVADTIKSLTRAGEVTAKIELLKEATEQLRLLNDDDIEEEILLLSLLH